MRDAGRRLVSWSSSALAVAFMGAALAGCVPDRIAGPAPAADAEPAGSALTQFALPDRWGAVDPVTRVLGHAEALALSPQQVRDLEAIRERLTAERQERLEALRGDGTVRGRRLGARAVSRSPEEVQALRERLEATALERRAAVRARLASGASFDAEAMQARREALRARMGAGAAPDRESLRTRRENGAAFDREALRVRLEARAGEGGVARAMRLPRGGLRAPAARGVMEDVRAVLTDEQAATLRTLLPERLRGGRTLPR